MQRADYPVGGHPPDLMRRFIPTPLKAMYRIGSARVNVQTNDFALLPALSLAANLGIGGEPGLDWKLIRDADSIGLLEAPIFLTSGPLTVVEMGTSCLLGLDHERRELLGFIGRDIDAPTYREFLVPLFCRMTNEVLCSDQVSGIAKMQPRNFR